VKKEEEVRTIRMFILLLLLLLKHDLVSLQVKTFCVILAGQVLYVIFPIVEGYSSNGNFCTIWL